MASRRTKRFGGIDYGGRTNNEYRHEQLSDFSRCRMQTKKEERRRRVLLLEKFKSQRETKGRRRSRISIGTKGAAGRVEVLKEERRRHIREVRSGCLCGGGAVLGPCSFPGPGSKALDVLAGRADLWLYADYGCWNPWRPPYRRTLLHNCSLLPKDTDTRDRDKTSDHCLYGGPRAKKWLESREVLQLLHYGFVLRVIIV